MFGADIYFLLFAKNLYLIGNFGRNNRLLLTVFATN